MSISPNLPPAARRQVREANKLIAEMNAPPSSTPVDATTVEPVDPNTPPATSATSATPPSAAPATIPAAASAPPVEDFQQKYRTLQGKYDHEIAGLRATANALLEQNQQLLNQLSARPAQPTASQPVVDPLANVLSAKEREDFGEELIQLISRISDAKSGTEIQRLTTELQNLKSSMRVTVQEVTQNKQAKVYEALNREVKDWQLLNVSQQFLDWLAIRDIMSGTVRSTALSAAFEAGDEHRVVGIFKRFIEEDSRSRSGAPTTPTTPAVDQASLIAPAAGRGSAGEAPGGSSGRIWSEQEIDDFYSRVQRGRISPEEKKSTEAEIHKAMVEGRIRPRHPNQSIANSA